MNETRGNSRTKPMRGGLKGGEINSLKDSEKTNVNNLCLDCKYTKFIPKGVFCPIRNISITPIELTFITNCKDYEKN